MNKQEITRKLELYPRGIIVRLNWNRLNGNLERDYIYFGNMTVGDSNNTLDNLPQPFEYQNDGNVKLNITLYADSLYVKQPNPTNNYQFMVSEADEGVSYGIASLTNWNNIPLISLLAIDNLDYVNSSDEAALEVNITIPQDEDPGKKTSVMTFIAVIGE